MSGVLGYPPPEAQGCTPCPYIASMCSKTIRNKPATEVPSVAHASLLPVSYRGFSNLRRTSRCKSNPGHISYRALPMQFQRFELKPLTACCKHVSQTADHLRLIAKPPAPLFLGTNVALLPTYMR